MARRVHSESFVVPEKASGGIVDPVGTFGRALLYVARLVRDGAADDPAVARTFHQVCLVVRELPDLALRIVGRVLMRYRPQLHAPDAAAAEAFFLERDYEEDLARADDAENARAVRDLIPKVKLFAAGLCAEDRRALWGHVVDLLDCYIEHCAAGGLTA